MKDLRLSLDHVPILDQSVFEENTILLLASLSQGLAPSKPGKIIPSAAPTVPQRVSKTEGGRADFVFFFFKLEKFFF